MELSQAAAVRQGQRTKILGKSSVFGELSRFCMEKQDAFRFRSEKSSGKIGTFWCAGPGQYAYWCSPQPPPLSSQPSPAQVTQVTQVIHVTWLQNVYAVGHTGHEFPQVASLGQTGQEPPHVTHEPKMLPPKAPPLCGAPLGRILILMSMSHASPAPPVG